MDGHGCPGFIGIRETGRRRQRRGTRGGGKLIVSMRYVFLDPEEHARSKDGGPNCVLAQTISEILLFDSPSYHPHLVRAYMQQLSYWAPQVIFCQDLSLFFSLIPIKLCFPHPVVNPCV